MHTQICAHLVPQVLRNYALERTLELRNGDHDDDLVHTVEVVVDDAWIHIFYDYEIALSFHSVVLPAADFR